MSAETISRLERARDALREVLPKLNEKNHPVAKLVLQGKLKYVEAELAEARRKG